MEHTLTDKIRDFNKEQIKHIKEDLKSRLSKRVLALKPNYIREILKSSADPDVIPLSAGNPAAEAFPIKEIREISDRILKEMPVAVLQYGISEGYAPLRDNVKKMLKEMYNVGTDDDELIIVSGAQQVMDISSKAFLNEGDTVIVEAPSFIGSLNTFRSFNTELVGITMENDGMNMEELENVLSTTENVKFIYTIPNFQNPYGGCTSLEKRKKMYELAQKYDVMIIEDNPYGDLRYFGEDIPCIKSFDTDGRVIYSGSFSKVIAPGLRVGYMLANKDAMTKMIICKQTQDVHTSLWAQIICNEFITKYDYKKHLKKLQDLYRKKAKLCMDLLDKYVVPEGITYVKVEGGLFVWCTLPENIDMREFCSKLVERKVCVVPGFAFLTDPDLPSDSFRINFSTPSEKQLEDGIKEIGKLMKEYNGK